MATLTIRNLPDEVRDRLRVRAARAGLSMEAEARRLLVQATNEQDVAVALAEFQAKIARFYRDKPKTSAVDALIRERRAEAKREREKP